MTAPFPDAEHLADTAAGHFGLLDDHTFAWITEAVFKEWSLRREAGLPIPPPTTLPDRAAHDSLDMLRPDPEEDETPAVGAGLGSLGPEIGAGVGRRPCPLITVPAAAVELRPISGARRLAKNSYS